MWQRHLWISDKIMACTHYENCSCDVEIGGNFFHRLMIDLVSARPKPFSLLLVALFEKAISDCAPRFKMRVYMQTLSIENKLLSIISCLSLSEFGLHESERMFISHKD